MAKRRKEEKEEEETKEKSCLIAVVSPLDKDDSPP